ncbi:cytochrome P450 monooxygenase 106 [Heterobasidion irregulare TC 32-1]|uniref:Cytochrome P450 monooxygenase 106 n=1 Tax=Heterobasidion irregulare (strain TC 32-1) TaxID=747525 RepID=W4KAV4_HETIT|nr:cytochrome P450 monooxygenase 106 [Heterobasidion irregulare TC 32-1]ETW82206.1 cytochrome P450 monooxygenase 106 [Heterobasidion irregulare TC 32-1]
MLYLKWRQPTSQLNLPPGPPGHWLWGNEIPEKFAFLQFAQWTKEYGPMFSLRRGRRTIIVLGTYQAAMDILEKDGAITADRPRAIAGGEMISGNMRLLLVRAGEHFRKLRKALHTHLQPKVAVTYGPLQMFNARVLLRDILDDPENHHEHARRYSASLILSLTYGKPSPSKRLDPDIALVNQCLHRMGQSLRPGAHLVEDLPWLKYIPFYGSKLREYHREELALFRKQLQAVRDEMAEGKASPSFARYLLEEQQEIGLSDDELAYLAGSMFGAGSETSASAISIVIMAAALHPEAQARVQKELDGIVGFDRLPSFSDVDSLPQVHAFFLESFRWRPGTGGGIQRRATEDIIYGGYRIPAGATLIGNHWSIGRDPEVFPDGDTFNPQRWIDEDGRVKEEPKFSNFGFGRRICPGMPVALRSLFINTALLLWSFKITEDPTRPIDTLALKEGIITVPLPFAAHFEPRHVNLRELIDADDLGLATLIAPDREL